MAKAKKIGCILGICLFTFMGISMLLAEPISQTNTTFITGHFEGIKKIIYRNDVSYDLYTQESVSPYKISAEDIDCFNYERFVNDVMPGTVIHLFISKIDFFRRSSVTKIYTAGYCYLYPDCINNHTKDEKIYVPIFCLIVDVILILVLINKKIPSLKV